MPYTILELPIDAAGGFRPRGGALRLWRCREHEQMLSGPAETGKTWACCQKLDALCWKYPGAQCVMLRKTHAGLHASVYQTYRRVIGADTPITFYGGEKPEWAQYPNGSRIWFAGLDSAQKALSTERDFIYVNQAEELTLGEWETLATRCTGRGAHAPYSLLFGDCNPGAPTHWIVNGPSLTLFESRHEDNPTLFDERGAMTEQGRRTLAILDRLSGVRRQRLRFGRWAAAEGVVYDEWDRALHLWRGEIGADWRRIRSIDFGYINPFVCQWWAVDEDGRMYLYREIYRTQRIARDHAAEIVRLSEGERIECTVADHDAEDRATLAACGVPTLAAYKPVSRGIEAVKARLRPAGYGGPRLYLCEGALVERDAALANAARPVCTEQEFDTYAWPLSADGRAADEAPVKLYDHGMDALRYAVAYVDHLAGRWAEDPAVLAELAARR